MKTDSIDLFLKLNEARATVQLKLDEELGTLHGLSLSDFIVLLSLSGAKDGRQVVGDLVRPLGVQRSAVVRQLIPLEKTGHIKRDSGPASDGKRYVAIRPVGRRVLSEALTTADMHLLRLFEELKMSKMDFHAKRLAG
ncbi:MAG TPA: AsnC family transcriptional regulator [Polaromonas sp.]|uniref:AsnC family transcriptional regulator n=1 Tax=Polaromonas sp. TaxID=1869339 RepID=UPI002D4C4887|nr:AsnC family transcriptional regulator [Polaromonas sp.]HYW57488.1 AsnC family transcriptional regulator [Polaromonas sp.]